MVDTESRGPNRSAASKRVEVKVISHAPCGCKRYSDGTKYECLTHRYTYSGCQA